jgi:hypothetical protein
MTDPQPDVVVPEQPVLATLPNVELIHVGTWDISTGTWTVTTTDLLNVVSALDCPAVRRPIIKIGHTDPRFDGEPAVGWLDNLVVSATGHELRGDYTGIPMWLRDVMASAYPDRSIEGEYEHVCQLGHVHPFVLTGVALLGVTPPGVGTLESLQDIAALFGVAAAGPTGSRSFRIPITAAGGTVMPNATKVAASATVEEVRRSFYDGPGAGYWIWIEQLYVDPLEVIAVNDEDMTLWRHTFSVADDGTITWADPQQVRREYVAAATTVRAPTIAWASRNESRAGVARASEPPPAQPPATPPNGVTTVTDLQQGVRQRLGLADDATDEDVLTALNEQLPAEQPVITEPVEPPAVPAAPAPQVGENGTVLVDAAQFASLQQAAQLGAAAHARQQNEDRQRLVDAAVQDGRIPPARRDDWLKMLAADPGAANTLAKLAPGLVPVVEAGHGGNPHAGSGADADDAWFANMPAPLSTTKEK